MSDLRANRVIRKGFNADAVCDEWGGDIDLAFQNMSDALTAAQQHERLLGEALRSTLVKVGVLSPDAAVSGPELLLAAHEYAALASTEGRDAPHAPRVTERDQSFLLKHAMKLEREAVTMRDALRSCQRLFTEVLPKFNWGASALDANAIMLLNTVPGEVAKALELVAADRIHAVLGDKGT